MVCSDVTKFNSFCVSISGSHVVGQVYIIVIRR